MSSSCTTICQTSSSPSAILNKFLIFHSPFPPLLSTRGITQTLCPNIIILQKDTRDTRSLNSRYIYICNIWTRTTITNAQQERKYRLDRPVLWVSIPILPPPPPPPSPVPNLIPTRESAAHLSPLSLLFALLHMCIERCLRPSNNNHPKRANKYPMCCWFDLVIKERIERGSTNTLSAFKTYWDCSLRDKQSAHDHEFNWSALSSSPPPPPLYPCYY